MEVQHVGRSQFALVQDGRCDVKDASSGTTPLVHGGDVWHRQGSALQRMMSRAYVSGEDELQWYGFGSKVKREIRLTSLRKILKSNLRRPGKTTGEQYRIRR